jgi:hypothetical protein
MKAFRWLCLALFISCASVSVKAQANDLQLSTEIIHKRYCVGGGELKDEAALQMKLRLTYTNKGQRPLILQKGSNLINWVLVSRTPEDLLAKRHEYEMGVTWVTSGSGDVTEDGAEPSTRFIILQPGGKYVIEGRTWIDDWNKYLSAGQHVLQVIVPTWSGTKEQADKLRSKWERTGLLWFGNASSEPMKFTIDKAPKTEQCPVSAA